MSLMEKYSRPSYRVYRKRFEAHLGVYEEVLYTTYTGTIEPDDITESPLTKKALPIYKAFILK